MEEVVRLLRENNAMLREILCILRKIQDPKYIMEENTNDFIMNVVANLVAADIGKDSKKETFP